MSSRNPQPLAPAYLIVGDDAPKVELALKRLRARIAAEAGSDINIDEFDASEHDAVLVVSAANTLAFLAATRLVLVKRVEAWKREEKAKVAAYLEAPNPNACLALVAEKLPPEDLLRTAVKKVGQVLEYPAPREAELPEWLRKEALRRYGVQLGLAEARLIVERCGDNLSLLLREVEKLRAYAGDGPITVDHVRLLVSATSQAKIFDLLDALGAGKTSEVFAVARELLLSDIEPADILGALTRHFETLAKVAARSEAGVDEKTLQSELGLHPFRLRKLLDQARSLGTSGIRTRLAALAEAETRIKGSSPLPAEIELERCLGSMLGLGSS
ncbi:MAG: DNA polymerase III subunit delta [Thermoleophilia bacterium]|nr:DNA polymerase III subunit delta [Thermoleophilia bacterium]